MKKLLTILTLALALCLLCGTALAADALQAKYETYADFKTKVIDAATLQYDDSGDVITLTNIKVNAAELKEVTDSKDTADHVKYFDVSITGMNGTVEVKAWTRVRYDKEHTFEEDTKKTVRSCEEEWNLYKKCAVCGTADPDNNPSVQPAMAHTWITKNDATCTEAGYYYHVCANCGATEKDSKGNVVHYEKDGKTVTTDKKAEALKHGFNAANPIDPSYDYSYTAPACKEGAWKVYDGKLTVKCLLCNKNMDPTDADQVNLVNKAIADLNAKITGLALVAGSDAVNVANYKLLEDDDDFDGHTYGPEFEAFDADCATPAGWKQRCTVCGYTRTILDPDSEALPIKFILNPALDVTCKTATGLSAADKAQLFVCEQCGGSKGAAHKAAGKVTDNGKDGILIEGQGDAAGIVVIIKHTPVDNGELFYKLNGDATNYTSAANAVAAVAAANVKNICTDYTEGKTGSLYSQQNKKCDVCGTTTLDPVKTNITHKYGAYVTKNDSETPLYIRYCEYCKNQDSLTYLACDWVGKEHVWTPDADDVKAAKCGVETNITYNCANCRKTKTDKYTREHVTEEVGVIEKATCTEKGTLLTRCTYENCKEFIEEEIDALGHDAKLVAGKAATHLETGLEDAYYCAVCDTWFADEDATKVIEAQPVIAKKAEHEFDMENGEVVKEATCTEEGKILYTCPCGVIKIEITEKIAHTPVDVAEVPATCKEAGKKAGKICEVCKAELEGFEVIPADETAHVWEVEEVVAPTCAKEGTSIKTCKVCGKVEKVSVAKLAHEYDEGVITTPATKEADGVKTYTCKNCGETKTEAVKYEVTAPAKYTMTAEYDGTTVTGKLAHVEDTLEADAKYVRVTFYIGTYYMATTAEVEDDGTFSVDGVGPIEYITIVANGNSSVNPDDVKAIADPAEIYVK